MYIMGWFSETAASRRGDGGTLGGCTATRLAQSCRYRRYLGSSELSSADGKLGSSGDATVARKAAAGKG